MNEIFTLTDGRNGLKLVQEENGHYQFQFKRGTEPYDTLWLTPRTLDELIEGLIAHRNKGKLNGTDPYMTGSLTFHDN